MNTHKYLFLGLLLCLLVPVMTFLTENRLIRLLQNPISRLLNS